MEAAVTERLCQRLRVERWRTGICRRIERAARMVSTMGKNLASRGRITAVGTHLSMTDWTALHLHTVAFVSVFKAHNAPDTVNFDLTRLGANRFHGSA